MKRDAYYNEFDGAKAAWLCELIARDLIKRTQPYEICAAYFGQRLDLDAAPLRGWWGSPRASPESARGQARRPAELARELPKRRESARIERAAAILA